MLRIFLGGLRKGLSPGESRVADVKNAAEFDEDEVVGKVVPHDVEKGHFPVIAMKGGEAKRFIVRLDFLTNPTFLILLEQSKEEYGFHQGGAILVPCRPRELQKILGEGKKKDFIDGRLITSKLYNNIL